MQETLQAIDYGTAAASMRQSGMELVDTRRRRFGLAPGLWQMEMEVRHSGRQERLIPQNRLVRFESATLQDENYDITTDDYAPWVLREYTAAWFIEQVKTRFAPMGFMELPFLTTLDDPLPYELFAIVHPLFQEVGHTCPMGLIECATCRISLLESDDTKARIRDSGYDFTLLEELRKASLTSYKLFLEYARFEWNSKISELDARKAGAARGITVLGDGEHHLRKNLHEAAPEDRSALTAAAFGNAAASNYNTGMEKLAEAQRESAAAQRELAEALKSNRDNSAVERLTELVLKQQEQVDAMLASVEAPEPIEQVTKEKKQR